MTPAGEMKPAPAVSICVPTYNRAHVLGRTLRLLLAQTHSDFELIVSDDGSSDSTEEVVRGLNDPRILYFRNERNFGLYPNWNRCLELARGQFVAIYHDHNIYHHDIVRQCVKTLEADPSVAFVFTGVQNVDEDGRIVFTYVERRWPQTVSGQTIARWLARGWTSPIDASSVMTRRDRYRQVGGYAVDLGLGGDLDMWVRLSLTGKVAYIAAPLVQTPVRKPGDLASRSSWEDIRGHVRIHRQNLERAYRNAPLARAFWRLMANIRRDLGYLKFFARALAKRENVLVEQGRETIKQDCGPLVWTVVRLLLGNRLASELLMAVLPAYRHLTRLRLSYLRHTRFKEHEWTGSKPS